MTRILALALVIDVLLGEPPSSWHPVVWMGRVLDYLEGRAPRGELARLMYGLAVAIGAPACWAIGALLAERWLPWPTQAVLLKPTFAGRALLEAAQNVERAPDIKQARLALRALVSRPTEELDEELVSAAAIESLAENFVDSWCAPLLAYVLGGLPLAYAYRAANTADAMWGYRTPRYELLGKAAAQLDDVLNWVPARLGALLLGGIPHEASKTASPNAGWPMSAMAEMLGVRLEKVGHYVLNAGGRGPTVGDVARARQVTARAMAMWAGLCLVASR